MFGFHISFDCRIYATLSLSLCLSLLLTYSAGLGIPLMPLILCRFGTYATAQFDTRTTFPTSKTTESPVELRGIASRVHSLLVAAAK